MYQGIKDDVSVFADPEEADAEIENWKAENDVEGDDLEGTDIEGSTSYETLLIERK